MTWRLLLAVLLAYGQARATDDYCVGAAYFAAMSPRFPCARALSVFDGIRDKCLSVVWGTFGDDLTCVRRFLALPGRKTLLIHWSNEVCRRNGNCGPGEWLKRFNRLKLSRALTTMRPAIRNAAKRRIGRILGILEPLIDAKTKLIVSTGLEDNYPKTAFFKLLKVIREVWPYAISQTPASLRCYGGVDYCELHTLYPTGDTGGARLISCNDGFDYNGRQHQIYSGELTTSRLLGAIERSRGAGNIFFVWSGGIQGFTEYDTWPHSKPRGRTFSISNLELSAIRAIIKRYD